MKATAYAVAKAPREPTLRRVSIGDLSQIRLELPADAVAHILPAGHVTLLGGHGGTGKSILALALVAHAPSGQSWAGLAVKRGRAVFVSLEDPPHIVRYRLRRICDAYRLPLPADDELIILDGTNGDSALVTESIVAGVRTLVGTETLQEIRDAADGAALVVIDNASDAYDADENHRRSVRSFIRRLAEIARDTGAAILLLAHIDKAAARNGSSGNSYSGSTAWHNSARSRLALIERGPGLPGVELWHEKANLGRRIDSILLRFNDHGILVPADPIETPRDDAALLECLRRAIAGGDVINAARSGPTSTLAICRTLPGFPASLKEPAAFWKTLGRLTESGAIVRESYRNENRKAKEKWTLAPVAPVRASCIAGALETGGGEPAPLQSSKGCGDWSGALSDGAGPEETQASESAGTGAVWEAEA
jgi:hypothetical protein